MKKVIQHIIFGLCCSYFLMIHATNVTAQGKDKIIARFDSINRIPYNKVFINTDKHFYLNGDTLFFQGFLIDHRTDQLKKENTVADILLLDDKNKVIDQAVFRFHSGTGSGYLNIPNEINSGDYYLVANTPSMTNFGSDFFFSKKLRIINDCKTLKSIKNRFSVTMNTEGGGIAQYIASQFLLEVKDHFGKPYIGQGIVQTESQTDSILVSFNENGMSVIEFAPIRNIKYTLTISIEGKKTTMELPQMEWTGLSVRLEENQKSFELNLFANKDYYVGRPKLTFLLHQSTRLISIQEVEVNKAEFSIKLPKEILPNGLIHGVILNANHKIVAQRTFYYQKSNANKALILESDSALTRGQIKASLNKMESSDLDTLIYSIQTYDQSLFHSIPDFSPNLKTYLLLCSNLKEDIYNPNSYLNNKSSDNINNMLIGNNKSLIDWETFFSSKTSTKTYLFNSSQKVIRGIAYLEKNMPCGDSTLISFIIPGEKNMFFETYTDEKGHFETPLFFDFNNSKRIFYLISNHSNQNSTGGFLKLIETNHKVPYRHFDNVNKKQSNSTPNSTSICDDILMNYQNRMAKIKKMNRSYAFYSKSKLNSSLAQKPARFFGSTDFTADINIVLDEYVAFETMQEVIKELLPLVLVRVRKGQERVWMDHHYRKKPYLETPLFVIDGNPTFDQSDFLNLVPNKIESIKLIFSFNLLNKFGHLGDNGIIVVTSKDGSAVSTDMPTTFNLIGFKEAVEKNYPKHENSNISNIPDFRSPVYWNQRAKKLVNSEAKILYYHSDDIGSFEIRIDGFLMNNLNPISEVLRYTVVPE